MKYAVFDEAGFPLGFYAEDIHGTRMRPVFGPTPEPTEADPHPSPPVIGEEPNPDCLIPVDAVAITDEQWGDFLDNQGRRKWANGEVIMFDPPPPTMDLIAYTADMRWQKETGGIASPTYGTLYTDRETRAIIGQTIQSFDLGLIAEPINFKTATGFSAIDRTTLVAIATEIAAHVQSAFDTEASVLIEIADGSVTTTAEIDAAFV